MSVTFRQVTIEEAERIKAEWDTHQLTPEEQAVLDERRCPAVDATGQRCCRNVGHADRYAETPPQHRFAPGWGERG